MPERTHEEMAGDDGQGGPVAIIPARLGSTRFPGKVLADRTGKPLIRHVYESVRSCTRLARIVVATDDDRVLACVRSFGGEAVMTSAEHTNGTSRLAEAARLLGLAPRRIIVNCQGDEPDLEPETIGAAIDALSSAGCDMATVASPFEPGQSPSDPNIVKVVLDRAGRALYFSRALIPHDRDGGRDTVVAPLRHVGLYAYRRDFLETYAGLPSTPLERCEHLEQLRALEHGYRIAVAVRRTRHHGIDTPEQYEHFVRRQGRS